MLTSAETIKVVASSLLKHKVSTIVVDPVSIRHTFSMLMDSSDHHG